mgnify:CR=1 FL=1
MLLSIILLFARKFLKSIKLSNYNEFLGGVLGILKTTFIIFIIYIVVLIGSSYSKRLKEIRDESILVSKITEYIYGYSQGFPEFIQQDVNSYRKKVKEKEQFEDFKFKKNNEIILNKVEKQMNKICLDINEGIRLSEFKILKNEATFGTGKRDYENIIYEITDNSKIYLEGAIDRIDIGDLNEFRIIDYKSSDKNIEIPKVINGLSLQLITYLTIIEKKLNLKPTAMLYKRLLYGLESKKERLDEKEILKKSKKDLKMSGKLIIQDDEAIEELYIHDTNLGFEGKVKSEVIDIEKTKDNNIMKTKFRNILVKDEYENIRDTVIEKIKELSKNILDGNVDIYPYKYYVSNNKETACDYCEFKKICKHSKIKNKFRIIRK